MSQIEQITIGIDDRVTVGKFQSIAPPMTMTVKIEPGDDMEKVRAERMMQLHDLWERALVQRLWWRFEMSRLYGAPPPDHWAKQLYEGLCNKHFGLVPQSDM